MPNESNKYFRINGLIVINNLTEEKLKEYIISLEEKEFHAKQIFKWLHKLKVESFDEMTDISKSLRDKLRERCIIYKLDIIELQKSKDGTIKFLIKLFDDNAIESVFMSYNHGNTVCVSTQVGCKMGCKFCASTGIGFERNLNACEIEGQINSIEKYTNQKISNVVYMGIGEPLDNYENTIDSIRNINSPNGMFIGARHISISTCGVVDKIYKLADEKIQCTLSISLHSTEDNVRSEIMPINKKYNIKELLNACKYYIIKTKRRISFEYALIKGVNDNEKTAFELVVLLNGLLAHVNLIPINNTSENGYVKSEDKSIENFMNILNNRNIVATVRRELGSDIDAACGQLRRKRMKDKEQT